jgi:hypothetical protein
MSGTQIENALDLVEANLRMNRDEILKYIADHPEEVAKALRTEGRVEIPTSAGKIMIDAREHLATV